MAGERSNGATKPTFRPYIKTDASKNSNSQNMRILLFVFNFLVVFGLRRPRSYKRDISDLTPGTWKNTQNDHFATEQDVIAAFQDNKPGVGHWTEYNNNEKLFYIDPQEPVASRKQLWEYRIGTGQSKKTMRAIASFNGKMGNPKFLGVIAHPESEIEEVRMSFVETEFHPAAGGDPIRSPPTLQRQKAAIDRAKAAEAARQQARQDELQRIRAERDAKKGKAGDAKKGRKGGRCLAEGAGACRQEDDSSPNQEEVPAPDTEPNGGSSKPKDVLGIDNEPKPNDGSTKPKDILGVGGSGDGQPLDINQIQSSNDGGFDASSQHDAAGNTAGKGGSGSPHEGGVPVEEVHPVPEAHG